MKKVLVIILSLLVLMAGCAAQEQPTPQKSASSQEIEKVDKAIFCELYDKVELKSMREDVEALLGVEGEDVTTGELGDKYSSILYKKGNYGVKVEYESSRVRGKTLFFDNIAQLSQYNEALVVYEQLDEIETGRSYEDVAAYLQSNGVQISTFLDMATGMADGGLYCWANADGSCMIVQFHADMTVYSAQYINAK